MRTDGEQPNAGNAREWRAQVAASWFDLRSWLAERRRLLRDPTLALVQPDVLAFGPVRFALLVWVVWPALLTSVIASTMAIAFPPPASRIELHYTAARALEAEAIAALGNVAPAQADDGIGGATELMDLHRRLMLGIDDEASVESARVQYRDALERYVRAGAPRAQAVLRTTGAMRRFDEIPMRVERAGLMTTVFTVMSGLVLMLAARSFRRRLRRSAMAHSAQAERAYLYLLPASTLAWYVLCDVVTTGTALAGQYRHEADVPTLWLTLAMFLGTLWIYARRAGLIAGVLAGGAPAAVADVRFVRKALVMSTLVALLQIALLGTLASLVVTLAGLALP
ncbi:MAG TPA: hypothetical protein VFL14_00100 [Xanthomonadales bacterium]|nr:hypothetical protein [Xanthomonadales bacterium]